VSWLIQIVGDFFRSLFAWFEVWRKDSAHVDSAKEAAVEAAKDVADDIISEIADERSKLDMSSDPDTIARRLRERKSK
jgi:hypothetical protein